MSIVIDPKGIVKSFMMSYSEREMDPSQQAEVNRFLQDRRQGHILNGPAANALKQFITESTARLTANTITPEQHATEITLLAAQQREIDPFTGMFNKEGFRRELETAIDVAREFQLDLVVLWIDGDGFGKINKVPNLGYAVGDRVIQTVAEAVTKSAKRASDIKAHIEEATRDSAISAEARPGGDEFAMILLGTNLQGAQVVMDRIREEVTTLVDERVPEYRNHFDRPLTVSIGFAEFDPNIDDARSLAAKADLSLLAEKRLKKFGNIPLPDLSDLKRTGEWIKKWVMIPGVSERLTEEHQMLLGFVKYGYNNPEMRDNILEVLVKAATRTEK